MLSLDKKAAYSKMLQGTTSSNRLVVYQHSQICFIRISFLSLLSFVAYPATRKQSPPSTSCIHSPVTTKQSLRKNSVFPALSQFGAIIVDTSPALSVKPEEHRLPPFQAGVFPARWGGATVCTGLLGAQVCVIKLLPPFLRLTFKYLHDSPHLCPKGTGIHAGIMSVIVT